MAVSLSVDPFPITDLLKNMRKFKDQIPFAESRALNSMTLKIQAFEVKRMPRVFRIRKNWAKAGTKFGVKAKFSNKRNLEVSIFSKAPWLKQQEEGGTKRGTQKTPLVGKNKLLMPSKEIRKKKSRLIPKRFSPAKLLAKPKKNRVFFVDTPGGGLILQRKGKGKSSKVRVLFFVEDQARIPAILKFEASGERIAKKIYPREFQVAIKKAMATAKVK